MKNSTLTLSTAPPPSLSLWAASARAPGLLGLAAGRRPTGSPGPWEAPGKARPAARPRPRLAVETGSAGTRAAGQSSLLPGSEARCPAGGCGVVRVGFRPSLSPGLRYRHVPETGRRFCTARDCHSPGRGRGSAAGERHPGATQSPKLLKNLFSRPAQKLF